MKRILFIITILVSGWSFGQQQAVTFEITPAVFTEDDEITITVSDFDPSIWGVSDVYLWAWSYDLDDMNPMDSPTNGSWTNSNEAQKFTNNGDGTHSFTMTPSVLYQRTGIGRIGMLVKAKNGDGDKKSQDEEFEVGAYQMTLTSPAEDPIVVDAGMEITISATATLASDFSLKANDVEVHTASGITDYSHNYTVNESTVFVLEATDGSEVLSVSFAAVLSPPEAPLPMGLLDGLNRDSMDATKATLVLYAPGKEVVHVIGDFNSWQWTDSYVMNKDSAQDRFWIELTGLTPQFDHMYQYLVDLKITVADPYSELILDSNWDPEIDALTYPNLPGYPTGMTDHAVTWFRTGDADYNWQVTDFERPAKTDLVIYELPIRDFDELHSFDAVKARLDYLEGLGVNAIEFMPLNEFDNNSSWGYNPSFHMGLDKYYGTSLALKQLIDECHSRGIAVLIDVVYNHATGQHPYYRMWNTDNGDYGGQASPDSPFFNATARHEFNVFNDLNHSTQATRDYVKRTVQYWINEFNVDGFRWDLTKGFTQNCEGDFDCTQGDDLALIQDRIDVLKEYADYQWEVDPDFIVIFEHLGRIEEEKQWADYRAGEGKGIMLWNKQTDPYNESTMGHHENGKSNIIEASYVAKGFDGPSAVTYMESHDEQRLMYKNLEFGNAEGDYSVKDLKTALERMEAAGAFFFTIPGPKLVWQFGELGYEVDIDFNGRTGEKPIRWEYLDEPDRIAVYNAWAKQIRMKLDQPIFETDNFAITAGASTGLKSIHLTYDAAVGDEIQYLTIIGNFGVTEQSISPQFQQTGTWYDLMDHNTPSDVTDVSAAITLGPGEYRIFGDKPFIDPDDLDSDGVPNTEDSCANTPLGAAVDVNGCEVFSLPATNFALQISSETCRSSDNGSISVAAVEPLNYSVTVTGNGVNLADDFTTDYTADNLEAGDYEVCITVQGQAGYEQCFNVTITEPEDLSVFSRVSGDRSSVSLDMSGSSGYRITLNGELIETSSSNIELNLEPGVNTVRVETDKACQGVYEETILVGSRVLAFPNPVNTGNLNVYLDNPDSDIRTLRLYSVLGRLVHESETRKTTEMVDMSGLSKGIYILTVGQADTSTSIKIVKN